MASWLDDLSTRAAQSLSNAGNSIESYLGSVISDPSVVATESVPGGNRTALELANGLFGGSPAPAPAKAPVATTNNAVSSAMAKLPLIGKLSLPVILLGAGGLYFLMHSKKRRG